MRRILPVLFLLVSMLQLSACGIEIVSSGNTGVKQTLGKIDTENLYEPGFYVVNPFLSNIIHVDNQVQKWEDHTTAYTKDVQQADVTYTLNYNLQPSASGTILVTVGRQWEEKLIPQVARGAIKNVVGKWIATDLVAARTKATTEIEETIAAELSRYGIIVDNLELTNIDYIDSFEQAVNDKVVAIQRAEESKNKTVQIEEQAKQVIITAEADARAMGIKTAALKESQSLVLYEAVQKWNGILPQIVTGDGGTLLNIPEKALVGQ